LGDAIQPSSSFAGPPPARPGPRRKMWRAPRRTLQLLHTAAVLKCALDVFRRLRHAASAAPPCGPGQSKCSSWEMFWQGVAVRLGGCDPAQHLLLLPSPRSARSSAKNVARPTPHFAASAHCRSLEVWMRSVPMVAGRHKCRSSVWPWIVEVLFAGNVLAKCCSSAWMRSSPASLLLASPPLGPGLGEKCAFPRPHVAASAHCRSLEV
jgi:hypothetical protein